eukprot:tig00000792_g4211.t1
MRLRALGYNVWFDPFAEGARMKAIGDIIATHAPDIIGLQECTEQNLPQLAMHPVMREYPYRSDPGTGRTLRNSYGVVLFSRLPFTRQPEMQAFTETRMGRELLGAEVRVGPTAVSVFTAHLESLNSARTREAQIVEVRAAMRRQRNAIFWGDTNILSAEERHPALEGLNDAWDEARQGPGYTYDCLANKMNFGKYQNRLDRMYWRGPDIERVEATIVGTEQVGEEEDERVGRRPVWPSDHFGVLYDVFLREPAAGQHAGPALASCTAS